MTVKIHNKEKLITNEQINQILKSIEPLGLGKDLHEIAVFKSRVEYWTYLSKRRGIKELFAHVAGIRKMGFCYDALVDCIYVMAYNIDEKELPDLQFEIIYALIYSCRERNHYYDYMMNIEKLDFFDPFYLNDVSHCMGKVLREYEELIENWVVKFVNKHGEEISDIMGWDYIIDYSEGVKEGFLAEKGSLIKKSPI